MPTEEEKKFIRHGLGLLADYHAGKIDKYRYRDDSIFAIEDFLRSESKYVPKLFQCHKCGANFETVGKSGHPSIWYDGHYYGTPKYCPNCGEKAGNDEQKR